MEGDLLGAWLTEGAMNGSFDGADDIDGAPVGSKLVDGMLLTLGDLLGAELTEGSMLMLGLRLGSALVDG